MLNSYFVWTAGRRIGDDPDLFSGRLARLLISVAEQLPKSSRQVLDESLLSQPQSHWIVSRANPAADYIY